MNTQSTDDLIRLLKERCAASPEPTATEAAAYVGMKLAEYGSYGIIAVAIVGFGIATGWLG